MKLKQSKFVDDSGASRPHWFATLVSAFLLLSGIGASTYSYIALSSTSGSAEEIVYVQTPTASPPTTAEDSDTEAVNSDSPIRTSTTRRRTTPQEASRFSETTTTLRRSRSSGTTVVDGESTSDDDDIDDSDDVETDTETDEQEEDLSEDNSSDDQPTESDPDSDSDDGQAAD